MRPGKAEACRRDEASVLPEVDREPLDAEQLADAHNRGLERVRERQLRDRLPDDTEEGARAVELGRHRPCASAGAQRLRGANAKRPEPVELVLGWRMLRREEQLERADRRVTELKGRSDSRTPREAPGVALNGDRLRSA